MPFGYHLGATWDPVEYLGRLEGAIRCHLGSRGAPWAPVGPNRSNLNKFGCDFVSIWAPFNSFWDNLLARVIYFFAFEFWMLSGMLFGWIWEPKGFQFGPKIVSDSELVIFEKPLFC